ncbi:MAG: hypothetical protein HDQ98_11695 [Lachnospiraceae bacterium]|nr:hypothetical protein [Lachnospiraceae bacterium]
MTFSSVFEISKIIALIFGTLFLVTGFIALVVVIIVSLACFIRENTHYVDAELLKYRLGNIYSRNSSNADFSRAIIDVLHEIDSILKGD